MCTVQLQPLSPMSIIIFVDHFFGIRTEALGTAVIKFTYEQMAAGEAFHSFLVTPGDLILSIVA